MKYYAIYSAGRSGSHGILEYFLKHDYKIIHLKEDDTFWDKNNKKHHLFRNDKIVTHYHGSTWTPDDPRRWTLIINYRKDLFSQFCSRKIAAKTGQYTRYPEIKKFHQLRINLEEALILGKKYYDYLELVRNLGRSLPWKQVIEVAYEDFVPHSKNLFDMIPLRDTYLDTADVWMEKSPYTVNRNIYNFEKNRKIFLLKFYQTYGIKL